jgi:site-specific recombinase XerD
VELFFTRRDDLAGDGNLTAEIDRLSIPDGMPFFLGGDGTYLSDINRFFRSLPVGGCRSVNTWQSYARDIHTFSRFLAERCGKQNLFSAGIADVEHYYRARRLGNTPSISARTWNRGIAALDKFYQWAAANGIISSPPFTYKAGFVMDRRWHRMSTARNAAYEAAAASEERRCIGLSDYLLFRDVGLLGRLPGGAPDPSFRGRNALRNAAFAELLVSTGTRVEEACALLVAELPAIGGSDRRSLEMRLAAKTTKREKGRTVWLSRRVLKDYLLAYIEEDRADAVLRAQTEGTYRDFAAMMLAQCDGRRVLLADEYGGRRTFPLDAVGPDIRLRLFSAGLDGHAPLALWLNEDGLPTTPDNIESIFARASERCRRLGIDLWVTPHVLRHTFAVNMLSILIRGAIGSVTGIGDSGEKLGDHAYRRVIADPLRQLQRLLGHSSITSTYIYLSHLEEAKGLVDDAVSGWSDRLGDLGVTP